jgi:spermidine synthase
VYDTPAFGRMLVHDQVVMATEFDEAHYHEMIAHVPLCVHPDPTRVLVIGGGDGGTIREILRHDRVKELHLCEIDEAVVEVSRSFLPRLSSGFSDPRVTCFFEDGAAFVQRHTGGYDLIVVDSSDPIGPAEVLFQEKFYRHLHAALREDGILVSQSESPHYHRAAIGELVSFAARLFPVYQYYQAQVPSYPSGTIGFSFCSKRYDALQDFKPQRLETLGEMRYYNESIHRAAFVLPESFRGFLADAVGRARGDRRL